MSSSYDPETSHSKLWLGATYHPEHLPERSWPDDVRLMTEAGLNVVRMADCAWSALEPTVGEFSFDWLDRAIDLLAEAGISTVLGTSNHVQPLWLPRRHPVRVIQDPTERDVLSKGDLHWCCNSPDFRKALERLVGAMADHFGPNEHVIGWQVHSTHNAACRCAHCQAGFRSYLAERYVTLDEFNQRNNSLCYGQIYTDWEQVRLPASRNNEHLLFDFKNFVTHCRQQLLRLQTQLLRPRLRPGVWIASSSSGWEEDHDAYALAAETDLIATNLYSGSGRHDPRRTGAQQAFAWGLKRRGFWVFDTQTAHPESAIARSPLHKDETQALAWQTTARGAEGMIPWQWRPAPVGQRLHHATLLDQSGQPRPFYEEAKLLGLEFRALSALLAGSTIAKARVAILNSYESRWALEDENQDSGFNYVEHLEHWYRPLAARNVAVDIVPPDANLGQYKMVIAPALSVLNDSIVGNLKELVGHSGHLVLTLKTGLKDEYNALLPLRQPGPLSTLAGVEVEDGCPLDEPVPVKGNWFEGVARHWAERLRILDPNKAVKIARYGTSNGWLDNELAITVCAQGTGLTYMVGVYLDIAAQQAMVDHFLQNAGLQKIDTPPGVEICIRFSPSDEQLYVVINHDKSPATVTLPSPAQNPLTGQPVTGAFRLAPYGVAVLAKS